MNERIKELALEAKFNLPNPLVEGVNGPGVVTTRDKLAKFAELIVKECLIIVKCNTYGPNGTYDYSYSDENAAADNRAEEIYEDIAYHFGVEE